VTADGSVYGCAKIAGVDAFAETHKLGDVWGGMTAIAARDRLLDTSGSERGQCLECVYRDECSGGCPATNYEATGDELQPDPLQCALAPIHHELRRRLQTFVPQGTCEVRDDESS